MVKNGEDRYFYASLPLYCSVCLMEIDNGGDKVFLFSIYFIVRVKMSNKKITYIFELFDYL